jgi:tetratricopeptide (TPR) repeat protein
MLSKQPLLSSNSSLNAAFLQRNAEQLNSIELFAKLSEGFTIAFMEVNSDRDRGTVIEYLEHSDNYPDVQWVSIVLSDEGLQYFGLEVREKLQSVKLMPDHQPVLLISGLERSIGGAGEYPQVLSNLNMERDSYPRILPYPIVLLLPSYAITRCARYAPDFWSWKSIEVRLHSELLSQDLSPKINPVFTTSNKIKPVSQSRFDLLAELLTENPEPTIDRARLLNQLGDAYASIYKNDEAESAYRSALDIYDNFPNSLDRAKTLDGLANLYKLQGEFAVALKLWQQALELNREIGDRRGEAASFHHLAIIYQGLGDLNKALQLSQDSIEINRDIGNRYGEAASIHVQSMIYKRLGDLNQALTLSQQSIEICRDIGNREGEAASLLQLSIIHNNLEDLNQALTFSQQSIDIYRDIGNREGEVGSLHQMALIFAKQGDLERSKELFLQTAEVLGLIGNYRDLIITLCNLGVRDEPNGFSYLAQALWLTIQRFTNLKDAIDLMEIFYHQVPCIDILESLLGATACYLCQTRTHPEIEQLIELSDKMMIGSAIQQGVETPADYDNWKSTNRLDDPDYFLPELLRRLEAIVGDGWLFDKSAFEQGAE